MVTSNNEVINRAINYTNLSLFSTGKQPSGFVKTSNVTVVIRENENVKADFKSVKHSRLLDFIVVGDKK